MFGAAPFTRRPYSARQALVQTTPPVVPSFGWFAPLSEPVRVKRGLLPSEQQFAAAPPFPPIVPFGWYVPFSEPVVKVKQGLHASKQQFLAAPARLLPNPTITGTLNAIETKDTMAAGGRVFNAPAQAKVGFIEQRAPNISGVIEKSS